MSKRKLKQRLLKVLGSAGATFLALLSSAQVIEEKMSFLPLGAWLVGGPIITGWWAWELFCSGDDDEQQ